MTKEWFKVEILQDYTGEDDGESLQTWKAGDTEKSKELFVKLVKAGDDSPWVKRCQTKVKQGVKLLRYHVVEEPHSPYLEWEIMIYKARNIPDCGEQVFLVPKTKVADLDLPSGDFMIFDNKRVVVNTYDDIGKMTQQDFYDASEGDDISHYLELKTGLQNQAKQL